MLKNSKCKYRLKTSQINVKSAQVPKVASVKSVFTMKLPEW